MIGCISRCRWKYMRFKSLISVFCSLLLSRGEVMPHKADHQLTNLSLSFSLSLSLSLSPSLSLLLFLSLSLLLVLSSFSMPSPHYTTASLSHSLTFFSHCYKFCYFRELSGGHPEGDEGWEGDKWWTEKGNQANARWPCRSKTQRYVIISLMLLLIATVWRLFILYFPKYLSLSFPILFALVMLLSSHVENKIISVWCWDEVE